VKTFILALALLTACSQQAPEGHEGHGGAAPPAAAPAHAAHGALPEGHAEVTVTPDRQQLVGLKLAPVESSALGGTVRATGIVQADEKREAHVHSRLMGWVRVLHVNTVGQKVKKGQPLYALYSQDLLVAQQEYLRARKFSPDLAAAARERLRLWEIPDDQIAEIERRDAPLEEMTVRSPIAGTVIEKNVVQGHFVEPDMMLYRIADLSRVWVVAEVYEYELGRVDRAGKAQIQVEGVATPLVVPIDYVYPTVDLTSRTVKVRLVVDNPKGELRPGNFAVVELPARGGDVLSVPEEAVIDTGLRQIVYVAAGEGSFRPVEVETGRRNDGRVEIRGGVAVGDRVVVSAQFLIDSESRLRATPTRAHGGH
jgi:membrane fusion protein, copper/silver efflux system